MRDRNYNLKVWQGKEREALVSDLEIEDPFVTTRIWIGGGIRGKLKATWDIWRDKLQYTVCVSANTETMREVMTLKYHCRFCDLVFSGEEGCSNLKMHELAFHVAEMNYPKRVAYAKV